MTINAVSRESQLPTQAYEQRAQYKNQNITYVSSGNSDTGVVDIEG